MHRLQKPQIKNQLDDNLHTFQAHKIARSVKFRLLSLTTTYGFLAPGGLWLGDIDVFTIFKRAVTHTWHKSIPYDKSIPHYYLFIAKGNVTKWGEGVPY